MNNQSGISRYLVEYFGECWHEWSGSPAFVQCNKCKMSSINPMFNLDLSTPDGFFWLWNKFKENKLWEEFWIDTLDNRAEDDPGATFIDDFIRLIAKEIDPETFARAVYEFLTTKGE